MRSARQPALPLGLSRRRGEGTKVRNFGRVTGFPVPPNAVPDLSCFKVQVCGSPRVTPLARLQKGVSGVCSGEEEKLGRQGFDATKSKKIETATKGC